MISYRSSRDGVEAGKVSRYFAKAVLRSVQSFPGGVALFVEDRRQLVLNQGHLSLVLRKLRKNVLGDALCAPGASHAKRTMPDARRHQHGAPH